MNKRTLSALAVALFAVSSLGAAQYKIDAAHSDVSFSVKHMMVSKTTGKFTEFEGTFSYDEKNPSAAQAEAVIQAASINTANADRDKHLKGEDFFDVKQFPTLTFKSSKVKMDGNKGKLYGMLTMHGVTKPVTLDLEFGGVAKDPWGNIRAGFEAKGRLNRKDYGIVWNKTLDNGGLAVGEDVDLTIRIEGIQEKAAEKPAPAKK
jgi:polyisoprenoid-binding protein YceI